MGQTFTSDDMLFHMLVVGGTGSGKTNAVLHMLKLLFDKKEPNRPRQPALFLFDPGGDASIDLLRAIPRPEWDARQQSTTQRTFARAGRPSRRRRGKPGSRI